MLGRIVPFPVFIAAPRFLLHWEMTATLTRGGGTRPAGAIESLAVRGLGEGNGGRQDYWALRGDRQRGGAWLVSQRIQIHINQLALAKPWIAGRV